MTNRNPNDQKSLVDLTPVILEAPAAAKQRTQRLVSAAGRHAGSVTASLGACDRC